MFSFKRQTTRRRYFALLSALLVVLLLVVLVIFLSDHPFNGPSSAIVHYWGTADSYSYCRQQPTVECCQDAIRRWKEDTSRSKALYGMREELFIVLMFIECKQHFTLLRYGPGEQALLLGTPYQAAAADKWSWEGGTSAAQNELLSYYTSSFGTSQATKDNWIFHGLPCPYSHRSEFQIFFELGRYPASQLTYSTIFIDDNYHLWKHWLTEVTSRSDTSSPSRTFPIIVFINQAARSFEDIILSWAEDIYYLEDDLVHLYQDKPFRERLIEEVRNFADLSNRLFLVSAGPFSKILINYMLQVNPHNQYVDVGSAIDEFTKLYKTRGPYQNPNNVFSLVYCPRWGINEGQVWLIDQYKGWEQQLIGGHPCRRNHRGWLPVDWADKIDYNEFKIECGDQ